MAQLIALTTATELQQLLSALLHTGNQTISIALVVAEEGFCIGSVKPES